MGFNGKGQAGFLVRPESVGNLGANGVLKGFPSRIQCFIKLLARSKVSDGILGHPLDNRLSLV
jgi:hypothetical protein